MKYPSWSDPVEEWWVKWSTCFAVACYVACQWPTYPLRRQSCRR